MKRILLLTGDGGEGFEAEVAAPSHRRLHMVMHDFEPGWDTYVERPGYGVNADAAIADVTAEGLDAVLIPGGRAPEDLRHDGQVLEIVRAFDNQGNGGRKVTRYEHVRSEVAFAGGEWQSEQAVRDGRMVTAQTWESHPEFYREVMACLAS